MGLRFDDLRVLQAAEAVADDIWTLVVGWDNFAKDVVGRQLARAADSVGANISEAFGRYHYGEKLQFLYYARGSLFETKYWINRAHQRGLVRSDEVDAYAQRLNDVARMINGFAQMIRGQKNTKPPNSISEQTATYMVEMKTNTDGPIFNSDDLSALLTIPNQRPS